MKILIINTHGNYLIIESSIKSKTNIIIIEIDGFELESVELFAHIITLNKRHLTVKTFCYFVKIWK